MQLKLLLGAQIHKFILLVLKIFNEGFKSPSQTDISLV
jgi:hypothetical protein